MSKKESNPCPPDKSNRPAPPLPPPSKIIHEGFLSYKITKEPDIVITGEHIPPKYYGYARYRNSGYAETTKCEKCETIGLEEDCWTSHPCKYCGGQVESNGPAKWISPVYAGFLWWKKLLVRGYWNPPK